VAQPHPRPRHGAGAGGRDWCVAELLPGPLKQDCRHQPVLHGGAAQAPYLPRPNIFQKEAVHLRHRSNATWLPPRTIALYPPCIPRHCIAAHSMLHHGRSGSGFPNMDFLGTPDIGALAFFGLMLASLVTSFIGVFTGAAGGIVLLGLMAMVMPPLVLIPVHTV